MTRRRCRNWPTTKASFAWEKDRRPLAISSFKRALDLGGAADSDFLRAVYLNLFEASVRAGRLDDADTYLKTAWTHANTESGIRSSLLLLSRARRPNSGPQSNRQGGGAGGAFRKSGPRLALAARVRTGPRARRPRGPRCCCGGVQPFGRTCRRGAPVAGPGRLQVLAPRPPARTLRSALPAPCARGSNAGCDRRARARQGKDVP